MSDNQPKLVLQINKYGSVAQILNERELVINIGTKNKVKMGAVYKVLSQTPTIIIDPVTGEKLGQIIQEKVRVKVSQVHDRFSICKTYRTTEIEGGPLYNAAGIGTIASLARPPQTFVETLRADQSDLPPPLDEEESFVKIGDKVELIEDS